MQNDKALRQHLLTLLKGADAHVDFESAIKDFPVALQGQKPKGAAHSPWEVLEHLRITQWDILEFSRNPKHKSPEFPAGYWPGTPAPPNKKVWEQSVEAFRKDLGALCDLVVGLGAEVVGCAFLIELSFLGGRERLAPRPVFALIEYES